MLRLREHSLIFVIATIILVCDVECNTRHNCKLVPIETEHGLVGYCCVFESTVNNDSSNIEKLLKKKLEDLTETDTYSKRPIHSQDSDSHYHNNDRITHQTSSVNRNSGSSSNYNRVNANHNNDGDRLNVNKSNFDRNSEAVSFPNSNRGNTHESSDRLSVNEMSFNRNNDPIPHHNRDSSYGNNDDRFNNNDTMILFPIYNNNNRSNSSFDYDYNMSTSERATTSSNMSAPNLKDRFNVNAPVTCTKGYKKTSNGCVKVF